MRSLLLILFVGLASGLQPGHKYKYQYRSRVTLGIPELREDAAAAVDLRADLNVYATAAGQLVMKLDNVKFARFKGLNNHSYDDLDEAIPAKYESTGMEIGKHPFAVKQKNRIEFHNDEMEATKNFYRSVLYLFGVAPVKETFFGSDDKHGNESFFDTTEYSMMGVCRTTYTNHMLSGPEAATHQRFLEDNIINDCQNIVNSNSASSNSNSNCEKIESDSYILTRSTNLEDCVDRVHFQFYLGDALTCDPSDDQCKNIFSRNSHGLYIVRGSPSGMRIEKAYMKGTMLRSPMSMKSEFFKSVTKQRLILLSVEPLKQNEVPAMNFQKKQESSMAQFIVPDDIDSSSADSWAIATNYTHFYKEMLNGFTPDSDMMKERIRHIVEGIKTAETLLKPETKVEVNDAVSYLATTSMTMYDFTLEHFNTVKENLPKNNLHCFVSAVSAVGTDDAVQFVLQNLDQLTPIQQVAAMASLTHHLKESKSLARIMHYIQRQDMMENPFKVSQYIVNFATLVRRMCVDTKRSGNSLGEFKGCKAENIVSDFENYVIEMLNSNPKIWWKEMIAIKALVNVKTIKATNALLPLILNSQSTSTDTTSRVVALDALASWYAASINQRNKYVGILLDILENPGEKRELRARALGYLSSWELTSTEWSRLAMFTKRPGNKDLAALTYSLIKSTSEFKSPGTLKQMRYAQHALAQAKHFSKSLRTSSFFTWVKYSFKYQVEMLDHFTYIQDPSSPLPSELAMYSRKNIGGIVVHCGMEAMLSNDDGDLDAVAIDLLLNKKRFPSGPNATNDPWSKLIRLLKDNLKIKERVRETIRGLVSMMEMSGGELYVPFENRMLTDFMSAISISAPYLGLRGPSSLYVNSVEYNIYFLNDLGMVTLYNGIAPLLLMFNGTAEFGNTGAGKYELMSRDTRFLSSRLHCSYLQVLIPWAKHKLISGITQTWTVDLPFSPSVRVAEKVQESDTSSIEISFSSNFKERVALAASRSIPFVSSGSTSMWTIGENAINSFPLRCDEKNNHMKTGKFEKMHLFYNFVEDEPFFNGNAGDMTTRAKKVMKKLMMPSVKFHNRVVFMNLNDTDSVSMTLNMSCTELKRSSRAGKLVSPYGQDTFQDNELCPTPERVTYGFTDLKNPQLLGFLDHLRKGRDWQNDVEGFSLRVTMEEKKKNEVNLKAMEAVFAQTECHSLRNMTQKRKAFTFACNDDSLYTYCVDASGTVPKLNDMDTIKDIMNKNLSVECVYDIHAGDRCRDRVETMHEKRYMTPEHLEDLKAEIMDAEANSDVTTDLVEKFHEEALYDRGNMDVEFYIEKINKYPTAKFAVKIWQEIMRHLFNVETPEYDEDHNGVQIYNSTFENIGDSEWRIKQKINKHNTTTDIKITNEWLECDAYVNFFSNYHLESDFCIVSNDMVQTFDGLDVNTTIKDCPVLLTTTCESNEEYPFVVAAQTNKEGHFSVDISSQFVEMKFNVSSEGVEVNGEMMEPDLYVKEYKFRHPFAGDERVGATVYKRNGFYKVEIVDILDVILKENKVYVKVMDDHRGYVCGLCGNLDMKPYNDLVSPDMCAIVNSTSFAEAWTPETSDKCRGGFTPTPEECYKIDDSATKNYSPHRLTEE